MSLKGISLFAGAGGMDVGFKQAGIQVTVANELDRFACETYKANHPESKMLEGDLNQHYNYFDTQKERIDVIFGGPPCQGFSVAGRMDPNDPRSKLVFSFIDVVEQVQPKAFVMENVKALGKLEKFSFVRDKLRARSQELSYNTYEFILNAKDFGVPQSRERFFFIGLHKDYEPLTYQDFEKFHKSPQSLREAISHLGRPGNPKNPNITKAKITFAARPVMRKSPYAGMLFNGQGRPLNSDSWCSTLPASMGGNRTPIVDEDQLYKGKDSWIETYHSDLISGKVEPEYGEAPKRLRRLTINEAAIIQTFPSNYSFKGPSSKIFSQIGNAVPCKLAEVVATVVANKIKQK